MKVLFVDDEPETVKPATIAVGERFREACVKTEPSFADVRDAITSFQPDIVVLDLLRASSSGELLDEGLAPLEWIWNSRIITMIIYSAEPERVEEKWPDIWSNPLVRTIRKGAGSDIKVADAVGQLAPYGRILNDARSKVEDELSVVFKEVAPRILNIVNNQDSGAVDAIGRATFGRLAARADASGTLGQAANAWEQYIVPVVSSDLMVGDVIVATHQDNPRPEHFRLVLTPSCDLAVRADGKSKVDCALVAKCCDVAEGLDKAGIGTSAKSIRRSNLLSQGFSQSIVPMPKLPDVIPEMMADLRALTLIPLQDIDVDDSNDAPFRRVASIDSPFRELVSWAYIQTAGRPGMPDRDEAAWAEDISARAKLGQPN